LGLDRSTAAVLSVVAATDAGRLGIFEPRRSKMELGIGLVAIVLIWLVVIYGSLYVNQNVQ
jgi:hypothetical protein